MWGHEHETCNRSDTHLHEQVEDCDLCAVTILPFLEVMLSDWEPFDELEVNTSIQESYLFFSSSFLGLNGNRGPPVFSPA